MEPALSRSLDHVDGALKRRASRYHGPPDRNWMRAYAALRAAVLREAQLQTWLKNFMRPAFLLIALFELGCIGLSLHLLGQSDWSRILPLEVFNGVAGFVVLSIMWTLWFERHWRAGAFGFCSVVLVSATVLSFATARTEPLFISVLLLLIGAGSLIPWDTRWQTALTILCLGWLALNAIYLPSGAKDSLGLYNWLALLAAAGLAHVGAARNEHQARELESQARLFEDQTPVLSEHPNPEFRPRSLDPRPE